MRIWLWGAFFLLANVVGVQVFTAALTLPLAEAVLPRLLTVPLIGLAALAATRVVNAWSSRDQ